MSMDLQEQVYGSVGKWQIQTTFVVLMERREQAGWWGDHETTKQLYYHGPRCARARLKFPSRVKIGCAVFTVYSQYVSYLYVRDGDITL